MTPRGCLLGALGLVGALFGMAWCAKMTETPADRAAAYERDLKYSACDVVQQRVKEMLKAPSTAKFDSCISGATISKKEGSETYTVIGSVDAQNSFGAMLRSAYIGTATHSGTDPFKGWHVTANVINR